MQLMRLRLLQYPFVIQSSEVEQVHWGVFDTPPLMATHWLPAEMLHALLHFDWGRTSPDEVPMPLTNNDCTTTMLLLTVGVSGVSY